MKYFRKKPFLHFQLGGGFLVASLLFFALFPSKTFAATSWQRISSPNSSYADTGLLGVAAITAKDAWAVGSAAGDDPQGNNNQVGITEHWNGQKWSLVPSPTNTAYDELDAVAAISTNDVWAVGSSVFNSLADREALIEHWNGTKWSLVPTPVPPAYDSYNLNGITAISANDIWAVGDELVPNDDVPLTMHWDGTSWKIVPTPIQPEGYASEPYAQSQLFSVSAISSNNVWAVGSYDVGYSSLTLHWDGTAWTVINAAPSGGALQSVSTDSTGDVWAVGDNNVNSNAPLAEYWDGTSWQIAPSPTNATQNHFDGVKVVSSTSVWAIAPGGVFHWNGTAWSNISDVSQSDGAYLRGVTSAGGFTGAVGYIGRGPQTTFIEGGVGA